MTNPLKAYGANLALLALEAAKAAGDTLLSSIEAGAAADVPAMTGAGIADFLDVVPASYRSEVTKLLSPEILAAQSAVNAGVVDRIHTGLAIAHATLDSRIAAVQASLALASAQTPEPTTTPAAVLTTVTATETVILTHPAAAIATAALAEAAKHL
jgi:hypothetical protein